MMRSLRAPRQDLPEYQLDPLILESSERHELLVLDELQLSWGQVFEGIGE